MNHLSARRNPALVLVDIQKGFDDLSYWGGERNNPNAEKNAARLLEKWRSLELPVFHIQHCSVVEGSRLAPGTPGNEIKDEVQPLNGEPLIRKKVNSAFIGTDLRSMLDDLGIIDLVIVGLTTDHCVSTTVRMASNFGYRTFLVEDAVATFCKTGRNGELYPAQQVHDLNIASLSGEFATIISTEEVFHSLKI